MFKTEIVIPKSQAMQTIQLLKSTPPQNMTVEPVEKQSSAEGTMSIIIQDHLRKLNVTRDLNLMKQGIDSINTCLNGYEKKNDAFTKAAVIQAREQIFQMAQIVDAAKA